MNLKYYLRGLGLGIIVTSLILGLSGNGKKNLTDAEIKSRALELGMIENTVLADYEEQEGGDAGQEETGEPEEPAEPVTESEKVDEEMQADETEAVQSEEIDGSTEGSTGATEDPAAGSAEADAEPEGTAQTAPDGDQMVQIAADSAFVLVIAHGDSSYSVAKKLFDMGLVPSIEEYDRYLCQNGYDRGIRAGTYEIKEGTSLEQIARIINGK